MINVALQNLMAQLVYQYEQKHGVQLNQATMVERFGFAEAKAIEAFLDGRVLRENRSDVLSAVAALDGDDRDASAVLGLIAGGPSAKLGIDEEAIVLNERLMSRLQNMERFLRRIGKMGEFHSWLAEKARVS